MKLIIACHLQSLLPEVPLTECLSVWSLIWHFFDIEDRCVFGKKNGLGLEKRINFYIAS